MRWEEETGLCPSRNRHKWVDYEDGEDRASLTTARKGNEESHCFIIVIIPSSRACFRSPWASAPWASAPRFSWGRGAGKRETIVDFSQEMKARSRGKSSFFSRLQMTPRSFFFPKKIVLQKEKLGKYFPIENWCLTNQPARETEENLKVKGEVRVMEKESREIFDQPTSLRRSQFVWEI